MAKLWVCYVWLQIITVIENVFSQYSMPMYSLQPAVDELHRQDYPLNAAALTQDSNYPYEAALGLPMDQYDWRSYENIGYKPTNHNNQRNRWNKQLGKYLPSEIESESENDQINRNTPWYLEPYGSYDIDANENHLTETTKRAPLIPFQKHENLFDLPSSPSASGSAFRERELLYKPMNTPNSYQMDLTDKFLRQIEKADEQERQERYREDLQNLWHKYQQQENNKLPENLFHEEKRLRVPPYYMLMQKKRSYPVLPWLPYTINEMESSKSFPLTKRSAKHTKLSNDELDNLGNNNDNLDDKSTENVEDDFRELFGSTNIAKEKGAPDDGESEDNFTISASPAASTASVEISMDMNINHKNLSFAEELPKSSISKSSQHMLNEIHNDDNDNKNNWLENMESKNSVGYMLNGQENQKADKIVYGGKSEDLTETPVRSYRRKKSIDWSQYFGIDRKRKSLEDHKNDHKHDSKRKENNLEEGEGIDLTNYKIDPIKLEKLRNKLRSIEDYIIRETVKYAGAHNGVKNLDEIEDIKDVVLTRLDTAYNLEKMRHVLDGISSKSLGDKNHLKYNNNANDLNNIQNSNNSTDLDSEKLDKNFEKLLTKNLNAKPIDGGTKERMQKKNAINNYSDVNNYIDGLDEFDMDSISPRHFDANQCHIAEAILERCRAANALIMPGEGLNQKLMYLCSEHQVCYLCGGSRLTCDYQYVDDADSICNPYNKKCQRAVQILLIILRDMPLLNLGTSECVRDICQNIGLQDFVF